MKKVATYVRVSNHSNAKEAQKTQEARLRAYCEEKGYVVTDEQSFVGERESAMPMLMELLQSAKEKGFEKVIMASTNRVIIRPNELEAFAKAFEEAGVEVETLDGSHEAVSAKNLIATFLASASMEADQEIDDEDRELVFGYDLTDTGLAVNESEAEVVKYIFARRFEIESDPPAELVQEVIDEYAQHGENLSAEEAKLKIPEYKINRLIEREVAERWPVEYESMIRKQNHNHELYARRAMGNPQAILNAESKIEPLVSREVWDKMQERIAEDQEDGQGITNHTM